MGEVSYKLMAILIAKQIKKEVEACVFKYQAQAKELYAPGIDHTEKLLSLSIRLAEESRKISLDILEKNDHIVKLDKSLQEYKKSILHYNSKS